MARGFDFDSFLGDTEWVLKRSVAALQIKREERNLSQNRCLSLDKHTLPSRESSLEWMRPREAHKWFGHIKKDRALCELRANHLSLDVAIHGTLVACAMQAVEI